MERIDKDLYETKEVPLYCHIHGLMQTASGYGGKLATSTMLKYENRWHRVYCMCYSNNGTCYILVHGKMVVVW